MSKADLETNGSYRVEKSKKKKKFQNKKHC